MFKVTILPFIDSYDSLADYYKSIIEKENSDQDRHDHRFHDI